MRGIGILFLCCVMPHLVHAQSTVRCKWLQYTPEPFQLDSLNILPSSFQIQNTPSASLQVVYDLNDNLVRFSEAFQDSILVCYQVLPFNLSEKKFINHWGNIQQNIRPSCSKQRI